MFDGVRVITVTKRLGFTIESMFQGENNTIVDFSNLGSERRVVLNTIAFTFTTNVNDNQRLSSSIEPMIHNEVSLFPSTIIKGSIVIKLLVEVEFSLVVVLDLVFELSRG